MWDREVILPLALGLTVALVVHGVSLPLLAERLLRAAPDTAQGMLPGEGATDTQPLLPEDVTAPQSPVDQADDANPPTEKPASPLEQPEPAREETTTEQKEPEIPFGADDGVDVPTVAWISYEDYREMVAQQGVVDQAARQDQVLETPGAPLQPDPTRADAAPSLAMAQPVPAPAPATAAEPQPADNADAHEPDAATAQPQATSEVALPDLTQQPQPPSPLREQPQAQTPAPVLEALPEREVFAPPRPEIQTTDQPLPETMDDTDDDALALRDAQPGDRKRDGLREDVAPGEHRVEADAQAVDDPGSPARESVEEPDRTSHEPAPIEGQDDPADMPEQIADRVEEGIARDAEAGDLQDPEAAQRLADRTQPGRAQDDAPQAPREADAAVDTAEDQPRDAQPREAADPSPAPSQPTQASPPAREQPDQPRPTSIPRTDSASDPSQRQPAREDARPGRIIVQQGLEVRTTRPVLPVSATMFAFPRNPVVRIQFNTRGQVINHQLIRSSGYRDIDAAIIASMYQWRVTGRRLEEVKQPFWREFRIILVEPRLDTPDD